MQMFDPPHPGKVLADTLGVPVAELAAKLGVTRQALYHVLSGKGAVSAVMALRLEKAGRGSAEMWMGMQTAYDLWQARKTLKLAGTKAKRASSRVAVAA